jgi:hypothetical protein
MRAFRLRRYGHAPTSESRKSAFITVLRSAFNQEADEAWRRAPSSSRSIEGLC